MNETLKIRLAKLLALAESPVPGEAKSALDMADKLMKKYGISASESRIGIQERSFDASDLENEWECILLEGILDYTGVEVLYINEREDAGAGRRALLVGRPARIIRTENLFSYLYERLLRLGEDYRPVVLDADSFRLGMAQVVGETLAEMKEASGADVRPAATPGGQVPVCREESGAAAEAGAWLDKRYGRPGEREIRSSFDPNSLGLGRSVGRKIPLSEALGHDPCGGQGGRKNNECHL